MRRALLVFLLWISPNIASARNGETGILVVVPGYQLVPDNSAHKIVICDTPWNLIHDLVREGIQTQILLHGVGVFDVASLGEDDIRVQKAEDLDLRIESRNCGATYEFSKENIGVFVRDEND